MSDDLLQGVRILVTGGTGFLGTRVVHGLESRGATLYQASRTIGYDLRNESEALTAFLVAKPDIVVHLAAVVGSVATNEKFQGSMFRDNMAIGMNVVHASAVARARLIVVGDSSSYPEDVKAPFKESDFWKGLPEKSCAPFGMSRRILQTMCAAYRIQFDLKYGYVIPSNLYGPGQKDLGQDAPVIPALIRRFIKAKTDGLQEVTCWGSGKASRSFLHVDDAAIAVMSACVKLDSDEIVNLPGREEISIEGLATYIAEQIGYTGKIKWDPSMPEGRRRKSLNGERAEKTLGWKPLIPFMDGIADTVKWYLEQEPSIRELVQ
jgi:GDP-L-fucose synthase